MVSATIREKKPWLVMIYIAADDVRKKASEKPSSEEPTPRSIGGSCVQFLDRLKDLDIDNDSVHLVVLYDDNSVSDTSRYHPSMLERARENAWSDVSDEIKQYPKRNFFFTKENGREEINSGHFLTLAAFVSWAIEYYPAEQRALIIVGHGGGWAPTIREESIDSAGMKLGVEVLSEVVEKNGSHSPGLNGLCVDERSGSAISTQELDRALEDGIQYLDRQRQTIDILFLDACLMGMVEVAYELRKEVEYLIAGENLMMATLAYHDCFSATNLNRKTSAEDLAKALVNSYCPGSAASWIITAIRTACLKDVCNSMDSLAKMLIDMIRIDDNIRQMIRSAFNSSQKVDYRARGVILGIRDGYVDLVDFLLHLKGNIGGANVGAEIDAEIDKYKNLIRQYSSNPSTERMLTSVVDKLNAQKSEFFRLKTSISRGIDDLGNVIESCIICVIRNDADNRAADYNLRSAKGLSIYLPIGEDDDRNDEDTWKKLKGRKHPQLYAEQLLFARDAPNWKDLLDILTSGLGKALVEKPQPDKPRPYRTPHLRP